MKRTVTTTGGGGMIAGGYALASQSWDFWLDNTWIFVIGELGALIVCAYVIFNLHRRVKALESRS